MNDVGFSMLNLKELLYKSISPGEIVLVFFNARKSCTALKRETDLEGRKILFWRNKTRKGCFQEGK